MPTYPDAAALKAALDELARLPPLVTSWEIFALKKQLAQAQEGKRFLLQGGDCAESFSDCQSGLISNRLKVLLQMSLVLVHGLQLPVVRVGRFAGQYAKPRSTDMETRGEITLPSYRGDLVNGPEFSAAARMADPQRMIRAHSRSAMTMNFVRALIDGGFADLHHPEYWNLNWVGYSPLAAEYQQMVADIGGAVRFMETLAGVEVHNLNRIDFYTSHEALLLPYEQALTRQVPRQRGWFNLSTHYPWIGMRTAALDGAHVEYLRGVRNPIAIKIGPSVQPDQLLRLIDVLNPDDEPGRLSFIHRMGAAQIADKLPALLEAVKRDGRRVLWVCDAMHGNTESTSNGFKTRRFDNIRSEVEQSFELHAAAGTRLGGVHLELTGEDVTECTGGARELTDIDLERAYRSSVDPRLNYEQSLEIAMLIVRKQRQGRRPGS
ncbi:phospho-2-dehydro-3-deoxyheptonate aldolase [Pseudoxanthomonas spadix BD-a59]|uniref:Phospho-2-dehydro-3-deoxyheptonate aldolase n=2 Tax=Pseudoxanthomonas spadix TaxID=415229 RepID=G7URX4_PSEUP|nr:phospho-2-dehydro-3-deoxyheptonate aldolase [Pseudoxanthomonas spadix BD-a59]